MSLDPEIQAIIDEYFRDLNALIATFNFTRKGREKALGREAAQLVAEGIVDRSAKKQGGADNNWPPNSAKYTAWKENLYNVKLIGFRTGQMISIESLLGHVDIEPLHVLIRYGTGLPPTRSMSSSYISDEDRKVTDTQKADFFTAKKGDFFEVDDTIADKVREHFASALEDFIDELNAKS
jgi:hypothetical protein